MLTTISMLQFCLQYLEVDFLFTSTVNCYWAMIDISVCVCVRASYKNSSNFQAMETTQNCPNNLSSNLVKCDIVDFIHYLPT